MIQILILCSALISSFTTIALMIDPAEFANDFAEFQKELESASTNTIINTDYSNDNEVAKVQSLVTFKVVIPDLQQEAPTKAKRAVKSHTKSRRYGPRLKMRRNEIELPNNKNTRGRPREWDEMRELLVEWKKSGRAAPRKQSKREQVLKKI